MRHRWVKLRIHVYICRKCGCGRVNEQDPNGRWFAVWHLSDGHSTIGATPPCKVGPKTGTYLSKYADAIRAADSSPAATVERD